jgi:hypothetical protein
MLANPWRSAYVISPGDLIIRQAVGSNPTRSTHVMSRDTVRGCLATSFTLWAVVGSRGSGPGGDREGVSVGVEDSDVKIMHRIATREKAWRRPMPM